MEQLLCVCVSVHLQVEENGGGDSEDEEPSTFRGSEKGGEKNAVFVSIPVPYVRCNLYEEPHEK